LVRGTASAQEEKRGGKGGGRSINWEGKGPCKGEKKKEGIPLSSSRNQRRRGRGKSPFLPALTERGRRGREKKVELPVGPRKKKKKREERSA